MVATCFRQLRLAIILAVAFLICGCATYPAFENPDIDYDGRWGSWDGAYGAYYDPSASLFDETGGGYGWYPAYDDNYYFHRDGEEPHLYESR